ncbi:MAG TPA: G1 family glutamic endopeptidase [Acidimicrobiales bacterium]|nr:G1 family glutamic endopeptidase [Acidimicrobiales bacterium]
MLESRLSRRSARSTRATLRSSALAAGVAAMTLSFAGAVAAPSVAPAAAQVLRMLPNQLISNPLAVPSSRESSSSKAAASAQPCWASSNWSGYAVASEAPSGTSCSFPSSTDSSYSGSYSSVSATWNVPTVTSSGSSGGFGFFRSSGTYSAVWTGIDGFSNDDLIQAGTEQNYGGGKASYSAWWEILPAAETTIPSITVDPGDSISVSITKLTAAITSPIVCSAGQWLISLTDTTADSAGRGSPSNTCHSYSGPANSAEYIVEAPEVNGSIATLADYGSEALGVPSTLTVNGSSVHLAAGTGGEMEQGNFFSSQVVSVPSNPGPNSDDFNMAYGSTAPSPPTT